MVISSFNSSSPFKVCILWENDPIAVKLSTRTDNETHIIKVIHAGILGIKKKSNQLLVTEQMNAFLPKSEQS